MKNQIIPTRFKRLPTAKARTIDKVDEDTLRKNTTTHPKTA